MFRGAPPADALAPLPFRVHSHTISFDSLTRRLTLIEMKSEYWIGVLGNI